MQRIERGDGLVRQQDAGVDGKGARGQDAHARRSPPETCPAPFRLQVERCSAVTVARSHAARRIGPGPGIGPRCGRRPLGALPGVSTRIGQWTAPPWLGVGDPGARARASRSRRPRFARRNAPPARFRRAEIGVSTRNSVVLPRTIGPDQADHLAAAHGQIDAFQQRDDQRMAMPSASISISPPPRATDRSRPNRNARADDRGHHPELELGANRQESNADARSAQSQHAAPPSPLTSRRRPGRWATRGPSRCGTTRPTNAIAPGHRQRRCRTASAVPAMSCNRRRPRSKPEALCGVLAEREPVERRARYQQQPPADDHQRQGQPHRGQDYGRRAIPAARTRSPVTAYGLGEEIKRERRERSRKAVDGDTREDRASSFRRRDRRGRRAGRWLPRGARRCRRAGAQATARRPSRNRTP